MSCNTKLIYPPQSILEDTYERMLPKPGRAARNGELPGRRCCASSTGRTRRIGIEAPGNCSARSIEPAAASVAG